MNNRRTIYLANPYGFSKSMVQPLHFIVRILEDNLNLEVVEPFRHVKDLGLTLPKPDAYRIAQANRDAIEAADGIFAVVNGEPPDAGVMVEIGIAAALGKTTFLFRDDFRHCADTDTYPLNLMAFVNLPRDRWEDYYFRSTAEINDGMKALAPWAAEVQGAKIGR